MAARFGLTWWGQRWIAALEALGAAYENRLPRGRTYARHGAVTALDVRAGEVRARVKGSRARPYRVALHLPAFDDATWQRILAVLAGEVRHAAALLDGRVPEDIDEVLASCGVSLFPRSGELATSCSCPDWANPCKHVAAVHYVLAATFDGDPFLLPTLRGRDRAALLAGLRAARSGGAMPVDERPDDSGPVAVSELVARELFASSAPLGDVPLHPAAPRDATAPLRALGSPPAAVARVAGQVEATVVGAAELAWALLTADGDEDVITSELRIRGPSSVRDLADAVGVTIEQVRASLRRLIDDGKVRRTGHGPATRYRLTTPR